MSTSAGMSAAATWVGALLLGGPLLLGGAAVVSGEPQTASSASSASSTSSTSSTSPADAQAAARISRAFEADSTHFFRHVTVQVENGVAKLGGYVWSQDAMKRAEKIAHDTPGITRVDNEMQLERQPPNAP